MNCNWIEINDSYHGLVNGVAPVVSESAEGWSWRISVADGQKQTWGRMFKTADEAKQDFERIAAAFVSGSH